MKMKIRPLRRRTPLERAVKAARDAAPEIHPSKRVTSGVTAVVATTAASAAISALRRRTEGAGNHR